MNWTLDIGWILAGAAILAAVAIACGIWAEVRRSDRVMRRALQAAVDQLAREGLPAAPDHRDVSPYQAHPMTVEDIHRKYEAMKVYDPKRAARRMYEEQLEIHGR